MKRILPFFFGLIFVGNLCSANVKNISYNFNIWNNSTPIKESPEIWAHIPQVLKEAKWILPAPNDMSDNWNLFSLYRETFELKNLPKQAIFCITADQSYQLYVNGKYIGRGPARGFQKSQPYDEIDIAGYLKEGKNVIAIRSYSSGHSTFGYISQGRAGVIFGVDLGEKKILSSRKTPCVRQDACDRDTVEQSIQLNHQEHIDMRKSPSGDWKLADFDDSNWSRVESPRNWNSMPFYTYEPRMIPMLENYILPAPKLIGQSSGKAYSEADRYRNICELISKESSTHDAVSGGGTIKVVPSKAGEFKSYLFDFGKVVVGTPILEVSGANGGEIIDIMFSEKISDKLEPKNEWNTHSAPAIANRMIARKGENYHEFYQIVGARYMLLRVRNNQDAEITISPKFRWEAYPMRDEGSFNTTNAEVNKIWQACRQTQKICSLDAYVDTPYREQAQWWGDARVQAWNTFFLDGDARLLRRGIRCIAMQTVPNGLTYGHAPTDAHHCILPDFSLVWICTLWDYYWQTGSVEAFTTHKKTIDGILSYFDGVTNPQNGLASHDSRYWLFLDWTNIQRTGQPAILNLWQLYALEKIVEMCNAEGLNADAEKYLKRATTLRKNIEEHLVDSDGLVCDGILPDGKRSKLKSIHAQVLGRMLNLKGTNFKKACDEILLPYLRGEIKTHAAPSTYWEAYLFEVMIDEGYGKDVYDYILKNWKIMADYGTTFESQSGADFNSTNTRSHAWSAHPLYLLPRILGGVRQTKPAWKEVAIKPLFIEDAGDIVYPTPQGKIKVSWQKKPDGTFSQKIEKPDSISVRK